MEAVHETYRIVPALSSKLGSWHALQESSADTKMLLLGQGADDSTTFTDEIGTHTPAAAAGGDVTIQDSSIYFNGVDGNYLEVVDHADFDMDTNECCIDLMVKHHELDTSQSFEYYSQRTTSFNYAYLFYDSLDIYGQGVTWVIGFVFGTQSISPVAWTPEVGRLYHLAFLRGWASDSDKLAIVIDGTEKATKDMTPGYELPNMTGKFLVGGSSSVGTGHHSTKWFRVTNGSTPFTANFDVPIGPCRVV